MGTVSLFLRFFNVVFNSLEGDIYQMVGVDLILRFHFVVL